MACLCEEQDARETGVRSKLYFISTTRYSWSDHMRNM